MFSGSKFVLRLSEPVRGLLRPPSNHFSALAQQKVAATGDTVETISKFENDTKNGMLKVQWSNGTSGTYPHVWLRDNAPEPTTSTISDRCRARVMLMQNLDPEVKPTGVDIKQGGEGINIEWPAIKPEDGPVQATYTSTWLKERNFECKAFRENRREYYYEDWKSWDLEIVKDKVMSHPTDFERLFTDPEYLLEALERFMSYGLLHLVNAPKNNKQLPRLEKLVGYGYPTQYGPYEDVEHQVKPSNLAYTNLTLGLHTDFPQLMTSPHIQILHVIEQATIGGSNQFCDGIRVAEELREEHPDVFELLSTVNIEFPDWGEHTYRFVTMGRFPVITIDKESGKIDNIHYNNQIRGWFMDTDPATVKKMYAALKMFDDYCYQPRNILDVKLNPGEMVMFANNRVLHGRSAFTIEPGRGRYYHGGFLLFDPVRSLVRTLREQLGIHKHTAK